MMACQELRLSAFREHDVLTNKLLTACDLTPPILKIDMNAVQLPKKDVQNTDVKFKSYQMRFDVSV